MKGPARLRAAGLALALAAACAHGGKDRQKEARGPGERGGTARTLPGEKSPGVKPRPGAPRVPPTPEGLLGRDTVAKLQQVLGQRGLLGPHRAGELDVATRAAVKRFQAQRGLAATGMPDRETLRDLGVSAEEAYGTASGPGGRARTDRRLGGGAGASRATGSAPTSARRAACRRGRRR